MLLKEGEGKMENIHHVFFPLTIPTKAHAEVGKEITVFSIKQVKMFYTAVKVMPESTKNQVVIEKHAIVKVGYLHVFIIFFFSFCKCKDDCLHLHIFYS